MIKNFISNLFGTKQEQIVQPPLGMPVGVGSGVTSDPIFYNDKAGFDSVHNAISDFLVAPIGKGNHIEALMNGVAMKSHAFKTISNALGNDVYPKLIAYLTETFPDCKITPNVSYENGQLQTFYINVTESYEDTDGFLETIFHAHVYGATSANFISMILPSHMDFDVHAAFFEQFKPPREYTITMHDGKSATSVRLKKEQCVVFPEFYPFLDETPEELIEGYYKSRSSTLILTGVWGSGKSTLARSFLNHNDGKFIMVDNPVVYQDPELFSNLLNYVRSEAAERQVTLFLDEMDQVITMEKTDDRSGTLARLLSMTSGIIELNIKVVITSNLLNTDKINEALIRGGRTYKSKNFTMLTPDEANAARKVVGLEPAVFDKDVTLGSALNFNSMEEVKGSQRKARMGFAIAA